MAIAVQAYSKIERCEVGLIWLDGESLLHVYETGDYRPSLDSKSYRFEIGSYSTYWKWQDALCMAVHGAKQRELRTRKGLPFQDLWLPGNIGGPRAHALYLDFIAHERVFKQWTLQRYFEEGDFANEGDLKFDQIYDDFTLALELAKEDGILLYV